MSLVDTMMAQMDQQNSQADLNYQPDMMMPIQPQHQVRMGEVNYMPPEQMQAPTMQAGYGMQAMPHPQQMGQPMMPESPETPEMDGPDMAKYGMEEEEEEGWLDSIVNEARAPLIVVVLAFMMSMPQVNAVVRNGLSRLTLNPLYVNVIQALLIGLAFWAANKFFV